jgi:DNA-binding MarR family transcriptional regulator
MKQHPSTVLAEVVSPPPDMPVTRVNTRYLETLMGYNARRAALVIIGEFLPRMAVYDLRPVDFSVLSLVVHNPGVTSRQLCATLGMQAPNLVGMLKSMERKGWLSRRPHPHDGRAMGLHPTPSCLDMMRAAEKTASALEENMTSGLSPEERKTLIQLLKKIYK